MLRRYVKPRTLLAIALVGAGMAAIALWRVAGSPGDRLQPDPLPGRAAGEPGRRTADLEEELLRRDGKILELEAELARLRARIAELEEAQAGATAETRAPVVAEPEPSSGLPGRPRGIESTVAWLQRILPERFGNLSAEEAALLTELDLRGAELDDDDLQNLLALPELRTLGLRGTRVTDAGIAILAGLPELRSLDLRSTQVSGLGLSRMPPYLEALHLTSTHVTGADLMSLPPMQDLRTLKLNFLQLDDAAIEALGVYPSLSHVELDGTALSDAGLRRLLQLNPNLTRIEMRNTQVSDDTVIELAAAHPGCELVRGDAQSYFIRGR